MRKSIYLANKQRAITINNEPTMTDQSQAGETDINIILKRYGISGQVVGNGQEPIYQDWTQFPYELRDYIELARSMEDRRQELPEQLRDMPIEELLALQTDDIARILTPPEEPANKESETQ